METKTLPKIPTHLHGKWYLNQEILMAFLNDEEFDLIEFCHAYRGFKLNEEAREELGEEQWDNMQGFYANLEMVANACFEINAYAVTSEMDEHLQLIAVSVNNNETSINLKSVNEDGLVEETTLVKNETENFISFTTENLSGKLEGSPVDLLYELS
jgi:hypothetical protein